MTPWYFFLDGQWHPAAADLAAALAVRLTVPIRLGDAIPPSGRRMSASEAEAHAFGKYAETMAILAPID